MRDATAPEFQIRAAIADDIPFLETVFLSAGKDMITAARGAWDVAHERRQFREQLDVGSTQIVRHCGRDVGFMMVLITADLTQLHTLSILPEWQSRGLGTALTNDLITETRQAGRRLELYVLKANPRARALYERLGFGTIADTANHHRMRWFGDDVSNRGHR